MNILILASPVDWHTTQTPDFPNSGPRTSHFQRSKDFQSPAAVKDLFSPTAGSIRTVTGISEQRLKQDLMHD